MNEPTVLLPGALLSPLARVHNPKGDIVRGMRNGDAGYEAVAEAYFTHILPGQTKGWKQHHRMVLNLLVASGAVVFHLHDAACGRSAAVCIGPEQPARLTVQPGVWVAFSCSGNETGVVLNLASLMHDPSEASNLPLDAFPLPWPAAAAALPAWSEP